MKLCNNVLLNIIFLYKINNIFINKKNNDKKEKLKIK